MSIETDMPVLPGFENLHVGLRQLTCQCGCGEVFFQPRVGRVKKFLNAAHKSGYYRNNRANAPDTIAQLREQLALAEHTLAYVVETLQGIAEHAYDDDQTREIVLELYANIPLRY